MLSDDLIQVDRLIADEQTQAQIVNRSARPISICCVSSRPVRSTIAMVPVDAA